LSGTRVSDQAYTIDKTPPAVVSITRVNSNPTAAATVDYTVTFTEAVSTSIPRLHSHRHRRYRHRRNQRHRQRRHAHRHREHRHRRNGNRAARRECAATITDATGNAETTGFHDRRRLQHRPQCAERRVGRPRRRQSQQRGSVNYTVTFSQSVTGVDSTDFQLTTSGVTSASVTTVTPVNGSVYTVAVNTGSGDGTIRLDVLNNGSIQSGTSVPLTGGTFTTGEVYTIDKTAPTVSSIVRVDADPTKLATIHFTATFSESVTGVSASTFALAATGVTGASITGVNRQRDDLHRHASTGSGDGTLGLKRSPMPPSSTPRGTRLPPRLPARSTRSTRPRPPSSPSTARTPIRPRVQRPLHRHLQRGGDRRRQQRLSIAASGPPAPRSPA